jgi:hypothetical protein
MIPLTLRIKLAALGIGVQLEPLVVEIGAAEHLRVNKISASQPPPCNTPHSAHHFLHTRQLLPSIEMTPISRLLCPLR